MKTLRWLIPLMLLVGIHLAPTQDVNAQSSGVVIRTVYAGGNSSDQSTFQRDFVELFNTAATPTDITGWSLQYSNNVNTAFTAKADIVGSVALQPGQSYLFIIGAAGTFGAPITTAADLDTTAFGLANNASVALVRNTSLATAANDPDIADLVGYGNGTIEAEGTPFAALADTTQLQRKTGGCTDTGNNADDFEVGTPAQPRNSLSGVVPCGGGNGQTGGNCGDAATGIYTVQENGASFGLGQPVTVEGIVTADYQFLPPDGLGGFYLQDLLGDGNPQTSDGVFVALPESAFSVLSGDRVRLTATPAEVYGQTTLTNITNPLRCGIGAVPIISIGFPLTLAQREQYEGMAVRLTGAPLTLNGLHDLHTYGEVVIGAGRRYQPTDQAQPGTAAQTLASDNAQNTLIIDDGRDGVLTTASPPYLGSTGALALRVGSTAPEVVGVLGYGFGAYRLHIITPPTWAIAPRPTQPPTVGGRVKVASMNLYNFFNGDGQGGGFPTPRGADDPAEYARQLAKLTAALDGLNADVIGVMELENDTGSQSALAALVASLNTYDDAQGGNNDTWQFIDTGALGVDAIRVGLIYDAAVVAPLGAHDALTTLPNTRPILAQTFREVANDQTFTVVVSHFKSKADCPPSGLDTDQNDGQGCWNATRTQAAVSLAQWVAGTLSGQSFDVADSQRLILLGDFNAYTQEAPRAALRTAGFHDLLLELNGGHSYVFDARSGALDALYVSPSLRTSVTGAAAWHINADEPPARDYDNDANPAGWYAPDPYRSSDHDPLLLGFTTLGTLGTLDTPTTLREGDLITITVTDPDWQRATLVVTAITPAGDLETVTLNRASAGVYTGSIDTTPNSPTPQPNNGLVEVNPSAQTPDRITVRYQDPFTDSGTSQLITRETSLTDGSNTGQITATPQIRPGADDLILTVTDPDLTTTATVTAITPSGESETFTLTGGANLFTRQLNTGVGPATPNNGTLEASDGETITFTYNDAADSTGQPALRIAQTLVLADNLPGSFALISPINSAALLAPPSLPLVWQAAPNGNAYTLYVFKVSNTARLGTVLQLGLTAADVCIADRCTTALSPAQLGSGSYVWSVIADGQGSNDRDALNNGQRFSLTLEPVQVIRNSGFEAGRADPTLPTHWVSGALSNDFRGCGSLGVASNCALVFRGVSGEAASYRQIVRLPYTFTGGEAFRLSADILKQRAMTQGGVRLVVTYANPALGTNGVQEFRLIPTSPTNNAYVSYVLDGVLLGAVQRMVVRVEYLYPSRRMRVDNVLLTFNTAPAAPNHTLPLPPPQ